MSIYISSACVRANTIAAAVVEIAQAGYTHIELSGGTQWYDGIEADLLRLQDEFGLHYLCHNYFPPPKDPFVVNLASLDKEVETRSLAHFKNSIELSKKLGAKKFGLHAGFLMNIPVSQIGKTISNQAFFDRAKATQQFKANLSRLEQWAGKEIKLYVENNVISERNLHSFKGENPLLLTDSSGLHEVAGTPLLDVAHLKVSCTTLGLNFEKELSTFAALTDYIHVSDNDGKADTNQAVEKNSELYRSLALIDWSNKTVSIEVYSGMDQVAQTHKNLQSLMNGN